MKIFCENHIFIKANENKSTKCQTWEKKLCNYISEYLNIKIWVSERDKMSWKLIYDATKVVGFVILYMVQTYFFDGYKHRKKWQEKSIKWLIIIIIGNGLMVTYFPIYISEISKLSATCKFYILGKLF